VFIGRYERCRIQVWYRYVHMKEYYGRECLVILADTPPACHVFEQNYVYCIHVYLCCTVECLLSRSEVYLKFSRILPDVVVVEALTHFKIC